MKKTIIISIIALFATIGIANATLWDFYGGNLPSVQDRVPDALLCGINDYSGTYSQNIEFENCLSSNGNLQLGGVASGFPPSRFRTTLAQSLYATASTTEQIKLSSFALPSGETLSDSDIGDYTVYTINSGSGNEEKISCTGISGSYLTGCTRGLSYKSTSARTANVKTHSPGETVIISDDFHYFSEKFPLLDRSNTFTNYQVFSTTTEPVVKMYFGDNLGAYLWYNTTTDQFGWASSTSEFQFNSEGTTFSVVNPILLTSGELKLATSTYDFLLRDNLLAIATSTLSGTASGTALDDHWNDRYNATSTKYGDFTFEDNLTVGGNANVSGNATTTGSIDAGEFCTNGANCVDSLSPSTFYYASSSDFLVGQGTTATVATSTIPAGYFGTSHAIKITGYMSLSAAANCGRTFTLYYGNTSMGSVTIDTNASTDTGGHSILTAYLYGKGSTSIQAGAMNIINGMSTALVNTTGTIMKNTKLAGTIDSTSLQGIHITATTENNTSCTVTNQFWTIEKAY